MIAASDRSASRCARPAEVVSPACGWTTAPGRPVGRSTPSRLEHGRHQVGDLHQAVLAGGAAAQQRPVVLPATGRRTGGGPELQVRGPSGVGQREGQDGRVRRQDVEHRRHPGLDPGHLVDPAAREPVRVLLAEVLRVADAADVDHEQVVAQQPRLEQPRQRRGVARTALVVADHLAVGAHRGDRGARADRRHRHPLLPEQVAEGAGDGAEGALGGQLGEGREALQHSGLALPHRLAGGAAQRLGRAPRGVRGASPGRQGEPAVDRARGGAHVADRDVGDAGGVAQARQGGGGLRVDVVPAQAGGTEHDHRAAHAVDLGTGRGRGGEGRHAGDGGQQRDDDAQEGGRHASRVVSGCGRPVVRRRGRCAGPASWRGRR